MTNIMKKRNQTQVSFDIVAETIYDAPMFSRVNFSLDEDSNFWTIAKTEIFDGAVLIIGSFGGAYTALMDIQCGTDLGEVKRFVQDNLEIWTDSVYMEDKIEFNNNII